MRRFRGYIARGIQPVKTLPRHHPMKEYELDLDEAEKMDRQLQGIRFKSEHGDNHIGSGYVVASRITSKGDWEVELEVDTTTESGREHAAYIDLGYERSLSLTHDPECLQPIEVSAVAVPARKGSEIFDGWLRVDEVLNASSYKALYEKKSHIRASKRAVVPSGRKLVVASLTHKRVMASGSSSSSSNISASAGNGGGDGAAGGNNGGNAPPSSSSAPAPTPSPHAPPPGSILSQVGDPANMAMTLIKNGGVTGLPSPQEQLQSQLAKQVGGGIGQQHHHHYYAPPPAMQSLSSPSAPSSSSPATSSSSPQTDKKEDTGRGSKSRDPHGRFAPRRNAGGEEAKGGGNDNSNGDGDDDTDGNTTSHASGAGEGGEGGSDGSDIESILLNSNGLSTSHKRALLRNHLKQLQMETELNVLKSKLTEERTRSQSTDGDGTADMDSSGDGLDTLDEELDDTNRKRPTGKAKPKPPTKKSAPARGARVTAHKQTTESETERMQGDSLSAWARNEKQGLVPPGTTAAIIADMKDGSVQKAIDQAAAAAVTGARGYLPGTSKPLQAGANKKEQTSSELSALIASDPTTAEDAVAWVGKMKSLLKNNSNSLSASYTIPTPEADMSYRSEGKQEPVKASSSSTSPPMDIDRMVHISPWGCAITIVPERLLRNSRKYVSASMGGRGGGSGGVPGGGAYLPSDDELASLSSRAYGKVIQGGAPLGQAVDLEEEFKRLKIGIPGSQGSRAWFENFPEFPKASYVSASMGSGRPSASRGSLSSSSLSLSATSDPFSSGGGGGGGGSMFTRAGGGSSDTTQLNIVGGSVDDNINIPDRELFHTHITEEMWQLLKFKNTIDHGRHFSASDSYYEPAPYTSFSAVRKRGRD